MKKDLIFLIVKILIIVIILNACFSQWVFANAENENKYYLGEVVNAGKDTGYAKVDKITEKDPHYNWKIGEFFVSGFTTHKEGENGNDIFLKNVGDKVTLWFCLKQDINKLNDNEKYSISSDKDGYDEYFGIEKTDFGKGTLIIRHKNYENHWSDPIMYTNYLEANVNKNAYTKVEVFEEGDYEVALNYEIKENTLDIFGWNPISSYHNYRIFLKFSVRNGNCMVYPFDVTTGDELTNSSFTENGFYIDFANSKYLNVNIKKEVLNEGTNGLVEDVRFNRPAKNGEQYTEEGIYTISVRNNYTDQETIKKIYVGNNEVLKAHIATGFTIDEIKQQMSFGATIGENGELVPLSNQSLAGNISNDINQFEEENKSGVDFIVLILILCILCLIVVIGGMIVFYNYKRQYKKKVALSNKIEEGNMK